jgi:hypothetical protein
MSSWRSDYVIKQTQGQVCIYLCHVTSPATLFCAVLRRLQYPNDTASNDGMDDELERVRKETIVD